MRILMGTTLAFFALLPCGIQAQTLWQNTHVGMSGAEVKGLFPEANASTGSDGEVIFTVGNPEIFGIKFSTDLHMKADKLESVVLIATNYKSKIDIPQPEFAFTQIKDELIRRYGPPTKFNQSFNPFVGVSAGLARRAEFKNNEIAVILESSPEPDGGYILSIKYEPLLSSDPPL